MLKEHIKKLGWDNSCDKDNCEYSLHKHSHTITLGEKIKKHCKHCGCIMKLDVHLYECEFGRDHAQLRNIYKCSNCTYNDSYILYDGQPQDFNKIYLEAEKVAIALSLTHRM